MRSCPTVCLLPPPYFYVALGSKRLFQMRRFMKHNNITDIPTYLRDLSVGVGDTKLASSFSALSYLKPKDRGTGW
jgi:hypothetical protein